MRNKLQVSLMEIFAWTAILAGCCAVFMRDAKSDVFFGIFLVGWTLGVLAVLRVWSWRNALIMMILTPGVNANPSRSISPMLAVILGIGWFGGLAAIHCGIVIAIDLVLRRLGWSVDK